MFKDLSTKMIIGLGKEWDWLYQLHLIETSTLHCAVCILAKHICPFLHDNNQCSESFHFYFYFHFSIWEIILLSLTGVRQVFDDG